MTTEQKGTAINQNYHKCLFFKLQIVELCNAKLAGENTAV